MTYIESLGARAKKAGYNIAVADTKTKNDLLLAIADKLLKNSDEIISRNKADIKAAKENGTADTMIDRLMLNSERIKGIADGVRKIAGLDDPVGIIERGVVRPNGLRINKTKVRSELSALFLKAARTLLQTPPRFALKRETALFCEAERKR